MENRNSIEHSPLITFYERERNSWLKTNRWMLVFWIILVLGTAIGLTLDVVIGAIGNIYHDSMEPDKVISRMNLLLKILFPFSIIVPLGRVLIMPLAVVLSIQWIRTTALPEDFLAAIGNKNLLIQTKSLIRRHLLILLLVGGVLPFLLQFVVECGFIFTNSIISPYGVSALILQIATAWFLLEVATLCTIRKWQRGIALAIAISFTVSVLLFIPPFMYFYFWDPNFHFLAAVILAPIAGVCWNRNRENVADFSERVVMSMGR